MKGSNIPIEMYFWLMVAIIGFVLTIAFVGKYSTAIQNMI